MHRCSVALIVQIGLEKFAIYKIVVVSCFMSGINCKVDIFVKLLDFPLLIHIEHKNGHKQSPFQLVPGIGKTETFYRIFFTFCSLASVRISLFGFPDR